MCHTKFAFGFLKKRRLCYKKITYVSVNIFNENKKNVAHVNSHPKYGILKLFYTDNYNIHPVKIKILLFTQN